MGTDGSDPPYFNSKQQNSQLVLQNDPNNNELQSHPKPGNRRRIKSVLPNEYQSNSTPVEAGNIEMEPKEEDQERNKAFKMIQEKIQAAAAEKKMPFENENYGDEKFQSSSDEEYGKELPD